MLKQNISNNLMFIIFLMFSFIECTGQSSLFKSELKANAKGNIVSLEWTAPTNENIKVFNIYKAEINDKSLDSNPADLSFVNIGATKEFSFIDKIEMIKPGKVRNFYYYVMAIGKNGKEIGQSNLSKVTISTDNTETAKHKMKTY